MINNSGINPFTAKGFPIDEYNRLALDRVKSVSSLRAPTAVKAFTITERVVIQAAIYFAVSSLCVFNDGEIQRQATACVKLVETEQDIYFCSHKKDAQGIDLLRFQRDKKGVLFYTVALKSIPLVWRNKLC